MTLSLQMMNFFFDSAANLWGKASSNLPEALELPPLILRIRMTNRCNLSCHYCYVGKSLNQKVQDLLTVSEWKQIIDKLPVTTLIDITGGEPFLTPNFGDIMDAFLDKGMKVSLITNGTIWREEILSNMVRKNLSHFMISLDGPEKIHDTIRGKGSFQKAINTARGITELKRKWEKSSPRLVAKVTVTEENSSTLEEFSKYLLSDVGFDGITYNLLFQNDARDGFADGKDLTDDKFATGNTMKINPLRIPEISQSIRQALAKSQGKAQLRPDLSPDDLESYFKSPSQFSPPDCFKYRSIVTLYSDGTLTPCDLGMQGGNIRDLKYNLIDSSRLSRMKKAFKFLDEVGSTNFRGCEGCCLKKHEEKT